MKIFFRKHGNSVFYFLLPVLFLALTVAFIQLTPQSSRTAPLDPCEDTEECCTSSGCGAEIGEVCENGTCERSNVGCEEGTVVDSPDGTCDCEDDAGVVIGDCVVCPVDENFINGLCVRLCGPNEDPDVTGCYLIEGSGEAFDCAANLNPISGGEIPLFSLSIAGTYLLGLLGLRARRKE